MFITSFKNKPVTSWHKLLLWKKSIDIIIDIIDIIPKFDHEYFLQDELQSGTWNHRDGLFIPRTLSREWIWKSKWHAVWIMTLQSQEAFIIISIWQMRELNLRKYHLAIASVGEPLVVWNCPLQARFNFRDRLIMQMIKIPCSHYCVVCLLIGPHLITCSSF